MHRYDNIELVLPLFVYVLPFCGMLMRYAKVFAARNVEHDRQINATEPRLISNIVKIRYSYVRCILYTPS